MGDSAPAIGGRQRNKTLFIFCPVDVLTVNVQELHERIQSFQVLCRWRDCSLQRRAHSVPQVLHPGLRRVHRRHDRVVRPEELFHHTPLDPNHVLNRQEKNNHATRSRHSESDVFVLAWRVTCFTNVQDSVYTCTKINDKTLPPSTNPTVNIVTTVSLPGWKR